MVTLVTLCSPHPKPPLCEAVVLELESHKRVAAGNTADVWKHGGETHIKTLLKWVKNGENMYGKIKRSYGIYGTSKL
jgi:hypothetical protein